MRKLICNSRRERTKTCHFARVVIRFAATFAIALGVVLPTMVETYTWNGGANGSLSTVAHGNRAP